MVDDGSGEPLSLEEVLSGWLGYAAENMHGWRMLFRDHGGGSEIGAFRAEVQDRAREVLVAVLAVQPEPIPADQREPTAEVIRAGLAGLVLWWGDHPKILKDDLVEAATRLLSPAIGAAEALE